MSREAHEPEPGQDDVVAGQAPGLDATPGDYVAGEQESVSPDTGVVYDQDGTPEETPHDQEVLADEEEIP
jgi:hypothetical protein